MKNGKKEKRVESVKCEWLCSPSVQMKLVKCATCRIVNKRHCWPSSYTSFKVRLFCPQILVRHTEGIDIAHMALELDQKKLLKLLKLTGIIP